MKLNGCKGPAYPKTGGKVVLSVKVGYDGAVLSSNEANRLGELKVSGTFFGFFHHL